jgi:hypothetical protein
LIALSPQRFDSSLCRLEDCVVPVKSVSRAHGLYRPFGFAEPVRPDVLMERYDPDPYLCQAPKSQPSGH